jgi:hypothetical protein
VAGTFVYTPPAGTLLKVGSQDLSVAFTPTNTGTYSNAVAGAVILVTKGTPTITWPTPLPVPAGTVLSSTQLDATANVAGTFVYDPPAGTTVSPSSAATPLSVGQGGTEVLKVTFTPTDTTDYNTATAQVNLTITSSATAVRITASEKAVVEGASVKFTATVPSNLGGAQHSGTVKFFSRERLLGTEELDTSGTSVMETKSLPVGANSIIAVYQESEKAKAQASNPVVVTVKAGSIGN